MIFDAQTFAIAEYGVEIGELVTAVDVLRFWEKPHNYPELKALWKESLDEAGERYWTDRLIADV